MSGKFKVGDRVRYTPCMGNLDKAWQNITLTNCNGRLWTGEDVVMGQGSFPEGNLELIPADPETLAREAYDKAVVLLAEAGQPAPAPFVYVPPVDAETQAMREYLVSIAYGTPGRSVEGYYDHMQPAKSFRAGAAWQRTQG